MAYETDDNQNNNKPVGYVNIAFPNGTKLGRNGIPLYEGTPIHDALKNHHGKKIQLVGSVYIGENAETPVFDIQVLEDDAA